MTATDGLIRILADGALHSGNDVAAVLRVTRGAVWKQVRRLGDLGLHVISEPGRGYRLSRSLELLDRELIIRGLDPRTAGGCEWLDVVTVVTSTNSVLAGQNPPAPGEWQALLTEYQTEGRGRRGRRWLSAFGSGLCFSVSWCFSSAPRDLTALSLASGIAVVRALEAAGASGLLLKWPNDVMLGDRKLGGILVDVDGDCRGPMRVVVGIGLNLRSSAALRREVAADGGSTPGGLDELLPRGLNRNALAAELLNELLRMLRDFSASGFAPLADEWFRHDYLRGRPVTVSGGSEQVEGIVRGIAADGALLVEGTDGTTPILAGEVSVRQVK